MFRSIAALLVAILLSCQPVQAQTDCTLKIKILVTEAHNGLPVSDATVAIDELRQSWQTDENGSVAVDSLCAGNYIVHVQQPGIEQKTEHITVLESQTFRIKVAHSDQLLRQVVVQQERNRTIIQSKGQLKAQDIAANSGKTLGDMLQAVNGVSTLSNGATISKPVIHGLYGNRILILNNGIRQEDQQWGGEHAPDIDPFLANNITVLKGASGVRYGTDAIGGVVLVEPAPLRSEPGWNGEVNFAGFSNNRMGVLSAMLEHNFKKIPELSFRVQGTFKKGGNYQVPGGYWVSNTGVVERNYSATVAYSKAHYGAELFYSHFNTDLGIYTGSHTGSEEDLKNAINSPIPLVPADFTYDIQRPRQHVTHDLLKLKAHADNRLGVWSLVYAYQHNFRQEYDIMRVDNGLAQLNLTLNTQSLNLNLDHKPIGRITGQVGVDAVYQDNFFRDKDRVFIPSYTSLGAAAYAIERYRKHNWTLEAGLRYDFKHYDMFNPEGATLQNKEYLFDFSNASGTLAFKQQLNPQWEWSATLSNAWRAPQANELFSAGLHQGAARIELGDKNLRPERAYSLNLETKYEPSRKLRAELSLYTQSIQDYIYLTPGADILTIRGYYKVFNYTQTNALLSGADLSMNYALNDHWSGTLKGSMLRAWDRSNNTWLIMMPADRASLSLKYSCNLSPALQECFIGAGAKFVARQTRIPDNFDQVDYPRPPADYFLLDAETGTTLHWGKQPLYCSLSVNNLLNRSYRDYLDVFRYFLDQPGTNVVLRLRVPFNFSNTKTN
jgi:iron complex outermembrane receptor protein